MSRTEIERRRLQQQQDAREDLQRRTLPSGQVLKSFDEIQKDREARGQFGLGRAQDYD